MKIFRWTVPDKSTNIPTALEMEALDRILRESTASENFVWNLLLNVRNSSVKILSPNKIY